MILQYVANCARLFVEWPPALDAYTLGGSNFNVINVIPVPNRPEDAVAETKDQDVLYRVLTQIVIDTEDLVLREDRINIVVQLARRFDVGAEGVLNNHANPLPRSLLRSRHAVPAQAGNDVREELWRHCKIEQAITLGAELFVHRSEVGFQPFEAGVVIKICSEIMHPAHKARQLRIVFLNPSFLDNPVLDVESERGCKIS